MFIAALILIRKILQNGHAYNKIVRLNLFSINIKYYISIKYLKWISFKNSISYVLLKQFIHNFLLRLVFGSIGII